MKNLWYAITGKGQKMFAIGSTVYVAKLSETCKDCHLNNLLCTRTPHPPCKAINRKDKTSVIWVRQ